jgi:hypothetical protein
MVGWVRQRPKVYYKCEERRQFFYGILLWGKTKSFRDRPLQAHTESTFIVVWFGLSMTRRGRKKREIWQSHRPVLKSIREIGVGGMGVVLLDGPTSDFFLKDFSNRCWGKHAPDHSHLTVLLKNAKWPTTREFLMCPQSRTEKRSQPKKTRADLVNWATYAVFSRQSLKLKKKSPPIPMYFNIQPEWTQLHALGKKNIFFCWIWLDHPSCLIMLV